MALKRAGVEYVHFEAEQIGHTITCWPPNTQFFSSPERIAIAGVPIQNVDQQKPTREAYLAYLRGIVEQFDLHVNAYERVVDLRPGPEGFTLRTQRRTGQETYACRRVVLCTGAMAGPRKLHIPGEGLAHVAHYFRDPHAYFRRRLLVVGGRNSAVEAALRSWRCGARVTLSYRRPRFDPQSVKPHLLREMEMLIGERQIRFLPATVPVEINPENVLLAPARDGRPDDGPRTAVPADFVLLATGFVAESRLFELAGVELLGEEQVPRFDPRTMETNVPGLYVAGTATGGSQRQFRVFIETSHEHVVRIAAALTGRPPREMKAVTPRGDDS